ncbi:MAG: methyltransferase [Candidatus Omnitrophica bacterium]|nr:methyltransferase [Candidatus Omnitrophota bacterium]
MMTSRERITEAINFRRTDRVPIDLGGMKASGITADAYTHLKEYLGLKSETRIQDPRFMLAVVEEEIRKRFRVDVLPLDLDSALWWAKKEAWIPKKLFNGQNVLFPPRTKIKEEPDAWTLLNPDGSPTSYRMPRGGFYFDDTSFDKETGEFNPKNFDPINTISDENLRALADYGKHLYQNTDYAVLGWDFGVCFLGLSLITAKRNVVTLGRPTEWMTMLLTEKETCHEMMDRAVEAFISCLKLINEAVGDYCFAWGIAADDSGTQRREFINPDLWAEMVKPHYQKICDWIHQHTKMKTFFHCCGSIYHLIPHLIEAGVDILNPVQTSAANMDPARLKKEFGDKIVFWGGGCDTQQILPHATAEEVRRHVKEQTTIFAPGGGYVFNQIHNIQHGVPPENIVAMFDAVL